ncbi:hypothetical protein N7510_005612 [Penicillium lagena]|uniref:uncharacterized protein n=1 Tax=Penicillium lagena TaxID=94218 RepID=UPI0025410810|nr:uncharacterized protein N7510_005612 [Penicillium lagena]KAJ5612418.1 hypothetical protein N7510_005612 [Penicillium lagena]
MQGYTFTPPSGPPREGQKSPSYPRKLICLLRVIPNYVFVDEHNRHKRLKGTRKKLRIPCVRC